MLSRDSLIKGAYGFQGSTQDLQSAGMELQLQEKRSKTLQEFLELAKQTDLDQNLAEPEVRDALAALDRLVQVLGTRTLETILSSEDHTFILADSLLNGGFGPNDQLPEASATSIVQHIIGNSLSLRNMRLYKEKRALKRLNQ